MFRSLRSRLVLSHILPFVLIIPLVGIAMAYLLETRLLLPLVYTGLEKDARLVAEISRVQPVLWENRDSGPALRGRHQPLSQRPGLDPGPERGRPGGQR